MEIMKQLKTAFILLILFTFLTGMIYPAVVTGLAQLLFPWKANGSLIARDGKVIGSLLIGQHFTGANYFWGRPSATPDFPYNVANSSGSNLGPLNSELLKLVKSRVAILQQADPSNKALIPVDLVTASGSGLDSDISPLAAFYQIPRIAHSRGISEQALIILVSNFIRNCSWGVLGEPRVNVLQLNLALDQQIVKRVSL
jgi:K+-transporting ATPase ATPase C chain